MEAGVGEPELVGSLAVAALDACRDRRLELGNGLVGRVRRGQAGESHSSWMRASTSSTSEMLSVSSMVAMDSLRVPADPFVLRAGHEDAAARPARGANEMRAREES